MATWARLERAAHAWLAEDPDPRTREELREILDRGDRAALTDRFARRLRFGTAGLRGELGAGPNRMNRVTVMRAAAGLAAYLTGRGGHSGGGHSGGGHSGGGHTVVVGYDARHGSRRFADDSAAVLAGAGLRALVLPGPIPTPVLAFAVRFFGAAAGVMVTASHNPPRDNGYKVYLGDGAQIAPPVDAEIAAAIDAVGPLATVPRSERWEVLDDTVVDAYVDAVCRLPLGPPADAAQGLTVVYTPLHGVGRDVLLAAFARAGLRGPYVVPEQADPDPDFPTVAFPNPEEPGALDLALTAGADRGADLVLANDPDADRCAVAVRAPGRPRMLTGDEVGSLLAEHVLRRTLGRDRLVVTTIVSSSLLARIAAEHGVRHAETLTGFKWIVRAGGGRFVYGYEEALGHCVAGDDGPPVRDKDGISAAVAIAGLAAEAKRSGRTLLDLLDDQARRYGLHATSQLSARVDDLGVLDGVMGRLRAHPPTSLGGRPVESAEDLLTGTIGASASGSGAGRAPDSGTGSETGSRPRLPPTDALRYRLAGGARVVVRPSGTEPKLKAYLEVVEPVTGEVDDARARAEASLDALRRDVAAATDLARRDAR